MLSPKNLEWIHTTIQKSLNLTLFEYKSYSEDVDRAIDKFQDIVEQIGDYEKIMDFHLSLTQEIETTRKNPQNNFKKFCKKC